MPIQIVRVEPGELVTAALFNRVIDELGGLEVRLAVLEGSGGAQAAVVIDAVSPSPAQVGGDVTIVGKNFGFTIGAHRVRFNGVPPTIFRPGSNDGVLICDVPEVPGLPPGGGPVELTVMNALTAAARTITVLPPERKQAGNLDVLYTGVEPDPIVAGETAVFAFQLESDATLAELVTIGVSVLTAAGAPTGWTTAVLDASKQTIGDRRITIDPGDSKTFHVRVTLPAGTNGTAFQLKVDAVGPGLTASSGSLPLVVGALAGPDDTFTISPSGISRGTLVGSTLTVPRDSSFTTVSLEAVFTVVGTYDVTFAAGPGTANWTTTVVNTSQQVIVDEDDVEGGSSPRSIQVRVRANDGATRSGGTAVLTVQRQGESRTRSFTFDLNHTG